jgi:hypothetical protein
VALVLIISARIGQLREIVQYCLGFCLFIFFVAIVGSSSRRPL